MIIPRIATPAITSSTYRLGSVREWPSSNRRAILKALHASKLTTCQRISGSFRWQHRHRDKIRFIIASCEGDSFLNQCSVSKMQRIRESLSIGRIFSSYYLSKLITLPEGERFPVNTNTFLKCLSMPPQGAPCAGNILIIQGGTLHMNSNSYYVRNACMFMPKDVRVFIFEKALPVVNHNFATDVEAAIQLIKKPFPGPLSVIGYSMGG